LIDRFARADIKIRYDNHNFNAAIASRVARWFLLKHYRKQTAEEWIIRWCNTSIFTGNLNGAQQIPEMHLTCRPCPA